MRKLILFIIPFLLFSCRGNMKTKDKSTDENSVINTQDKGINAKTAGYSNILDSISYKLGENIEAKFIQGKGIDVESLIGSVDLNMDITPLSLPDIRILRNSFAAKQGYCFMKSDLRALFSTTSWYNEIMETRYWSEEDEKPSKPISYTPDEQAFIEKLLQREKDLMSQNFIQLQDRKVPNLNNVVNLFQVENLDPKLVEMIGKNGFAIVPNNNIQLFHVYEQNDYQQFPNFVTTDMYMQLFHMYFGYVLRTIEEEKFIPLLSQICKSMESEMKQIAISNPDESIIELAKHNATYYSIAYTALTNQQVSVPSGNEEFYKVETANILAAKDNTSDFLDYKVVEFPYSLFKPRGHYTRSDKMKRYFRSMMWLQTAPFCLDNDLHLKRAILSAATLSKQKSRLADYKAIMEPVSFIIGLPDNVSFLQLAAIYNKGNYDLNDLLTNSKSLGDFRKEVKIIADAQNRIRNKEALSCVDKINFMPQRYLADNEILQELVDVESTTTKRGYPMGLDVLAAFGSVSAENILINELKEGEKWSKYPLLLNELKDKMNGIDWNASLYNKWIESLLELQKPNKNYPYFMHSPQWAKKDLNSALASWAELKHDAILYAEQPMAAECGGGGPPDPFTVAYVEPNIGYWKKIIELLDLTKDVLMRNDLLNEDISRISERLRENATFLLNASQKELDGKSLSEEEYRQIEFIGSTFEWITIDLVKEKDQYLDGWENVKGPDKSVAVVADIYTSNLQNNPDRGILHVATGNVNDIFVVVEIDGYLYLTKGAVLGYYEFHLPLGNRLTDEEWQEMLDNNQAPKIPGWIKEIIVPIKPPKSNEKVFYSSGC